MDWDDGRYNSLLTRISNRKFNERGKKAKRIRKVKKEKYLEDTVLDKKRKKTEKIETFLKPQILMKPRDIHRKWLFSLFIVVKVSLVVRKSHDFWKNSQKYQNIGNFLGFFSSIWYPNLWLVLC